MCYREELLVRQPLYPFTTERIKDLRARKQLLELKINHAQLGTQGIEAATTTCTIFVKLTNECFSARPRDSFGIVCQEDKKLKFLYFLRMPAKVTLWFVTCGGAVYCPDCKGAGVSTFSWLRGGRTA